MDETEVQVEIACWAQDHPEASTINWDNGNEPWVDFSGQRRTLQLGLGGLTWSIEVPIGYQTDINPADGKRKRLWDPLDYHDTVIVQSRSTPFHVSVVDRSNGTSELLNFLGQELANEAVSTGSCDGGVQLRKVHDKLKSLCLESIPQPGASNRGTTLNIESNAYFETLRRAETLTEVLDVIHGVAKLYAIRKRRPAGDRENDAECTFLEDEDDEHLFDGDFTMKWSSIAAQVNHAREACAYATAHARSPPRSSTPEWTEDVETFSKKNLDALLQLETLTLASPPAGDQSGESGSSDIDDEYTLLFPSLRTASSAIGEGSQVQANRDDSASVLTAFHIDALCYDSDKSDSSWEIPGFSNPKASSNLETNVDGERGHFALSMPSSWTSFQHVPGVSGPWDTLLKERVILPKSYVDGLQSERIIFEKNSSWNSKQLEWCDISFNPVSFSVECTLRLSEFMDNPTVAAALGFSLEYPLRLEIVPNKSQVDSLGWTGAVEVYVCQHSDWHNHISEDICGLLCLVPDIVQTYFQDNVPALIRNHSDDLFVGLLHHLVRRLTILNAGGSCCVCGQPSDRPTAYHLQGKSLWPCTDNICRARYATWAEVSSADSVERQKEENAQLRSIEATYRESFSYADQTDLKSALEVYGINADGMNYGQMIRALARIELWNQKDPDSSSLSYPVFDVGAR